MCIKNLKQLYVTGNQCNQVALIAPFQLGRAEPAQNGIDLAANHRQQLEGDIMIRCLFAIAEQSSCHCKYCHQQEQRTQGNADGIAHHRKQTQRACNGNSRSAEKACYPKQNCEAHNAKHGLNQKHQLGHDFQAVFFLGFFVHWGTPPLL